MINEGREYSGKKVGFSADVKSFLFFFFGVGNRRYDVSVLKTQMRMFALEICCAHIAVTASIKQTYVLLNLLS